MNVVFLIAASILATAGLVCGFRLVRNGTLSDRFVALNVLVMIMVCGIAVAAAGTDQGAFLDLVVVATLLDFVSAATIARFIEHRGS